MDSYKNIFEKNLNEISVLHNELSRTSPIESPDLFENYTSKRADLLNFFGVPGTTEILTKFDAFMRHPVNENDFEMIFQFLIKMSTEQEDFSSVDGEDRLCEAIDAGLEPGEILPRLDILCTEYTEFVYSKISKDEHLKKLRKDFNVWLEFEKLIKAARVTEEVALLKERAKEISKKGAPYLAEFLYETDWRTE